MHFEVERKINASPEKVWAILTDATRLASGPFGILRMEGTVTEGKQIKLWSEVSPKRAFPLVVKDMQKPSRMTWVGGMPLGAFTGTRTFTLVPEATSVRFHMREDYSGWLSGLIGKSIPDLNPSFAKFADALKSAAEET